MTTTAPSWDPFAPGYTDDPYPQLSALREAAAVEAHPLGLHVVWRYAEVDAVLRGGLSVEPHHLAPDSPMRDLVPDVPATGEAAGLSMLDRDPPDHTRLRRLVSRAFTPRAVAALAPMVAAEAERCLDELVGSEDPELVSALAFPLPFTVIATLLGMPPTDADAVRDLSGLVVQSLEPVLDPDVAARIAAAQLELRELVEQAIEHKRRHPADDLLTALVEAEEDGDALTPDELVEQVVLLYVAGHETTVNLIAGGVLALLRCPAQLALLRARPELLDGAVDELLRYDAPVQMTRRITTEEVELAGTVLPAGAFVVAHLAAANRDPRRFGPDADALRLDRPDARAHLSFAAGPHHCLGAVLARLEARVVLERLLQRCPVLELADEPTWNGRINLRGPSRVPLVLRRTAR